MTQEQLAIANDITGIIKSLQSHKAAIQDIMNCRGNDPKNENCDLSLTRRNWTEIRLNQKYLPVSKQDFVNLYVNKLDARIKEYEAELAAL